MTIHELNIELNQLINDGYGDMLVSNITFEKQSNGLFGGDTCPDEIFRNRAIELFGAKE